MTTSGITPVAPRHLALMLAVLFGLTGMGSAAVAVSIPPLAEGLDSSIGRTTLVVSCYSLSLAVGCAVFGRLGDIYGIRTPLVAGIAVMVTAACAGAFATSLPTLVGARVVQGLGASAIPALTLAAIQGRFAGHARDRAMASYAGIGATVNVMGPVIGAALVGPLGWRPVVAIPIVSLALLPLVWRHLPTHRQPHVTLDLPGATLVALAATGAVLALQVASLGPAVALAGGVAVLVAGPWVVLRSRRHPDGIIPAAMVRSIPARKSLITAISLSSAWFGMLVAIPTALAAAGWSGIQVGALLLPGAALGLVASRITSPALIRLGATRSQLVSTAGTSCALAMAALGSHLVSPAVLIAATLTLMLSFGLGQPAMTGLVADSVPDRTRGAALGLLTLVFLAGGSLGAAAVGGLGPALGEAGALLIVAGLPLTGAMLFARSALPTP